MNAKKEILKVKKQIGEIVNHFNLKYDKKWFNYLFIPREINILIEYLGLCPDPDYKRFGSTRVKRVLNLNMFIYSKEYENHLRRWGGQVYFRKNLKKDVSLIKKIDNLELRNKFSNVLKKIKSKLKINDEVSLLTEPKDERELKKLVKNILRHEITHVIFNKNNLEFQKKGRKYWKYDEGFVTYCDFFVEGKLNDLDKEAIDPVYSKLMFKWYFVYALRFRELLKDKEDSFGRKNVVLELYKGIK